MIIAVIMVLAIIVVGFCAFVIGGAFGYAKALEKTDPVRLIASD